MGSQCLGPRRTTKNTGILTGGFQAPEAIHSGLADSHLRIVISKALLVLVKQAIKAGDTIEEKKRREPGVGRREMFP
jgi:hypothetical protein